jgi:hypothetical protein
VTPPLWKGGKCDDRALNLSRGNYDDFANKWETPVLFISSAARISGIIERFLVAVLLDDSNRLFAKPSTIRKQRSPYPGFKLKRGREHEETKA